MIIRAIFITMVAVASFYLGKMSQEKVAYYYKKHDTLNIAKHYYETQNKKQD